MAKTADKSADMPQAEVKLKPILGIRPGVYLTILYGAAALILLFFLLIVPGLRNNGTVYAIESTPSEAAIYVDGNYAGSTPQKVFIEKGIHQISIKRAYFSSYDMRVDTGGRIFGTLISKKKDHVDVQLRIADLETYLVSQYKELSSWALINQFSPSYQAPRIISDTVSDFYESGGNDTELLDRFLTVSLSSLNGEVFMADFIRALLLRNTGNKVPTAGSLARTAQKAAQLLQRHRSLAFLVSAALDEELLTTYRESDWFQSFVAEYRNTIDAYGDPDTVRANDEITVHTMPFVSIPAGRFAMGFPLANGIEGELPHPEETGQFFMLKGEVTRRWYADFLQANPSWRAENRELLIARGLVDEWYLHDWDEVTDLDLPVAYVSFYAANAFADWINATLPGTLSGFTARLPLESEWEWAALGNSTTDELTGDVFSDGPSRISSKGGVENLVGSLWEWCSTWYHPADYFVKPWMPGSIAVDTLFDTGAEVVIRGGSWANTKEDRVGPVVRGSHPPQWCTQFTGFRIVLAEN